MTIIYEALLDNATHKNQIFRSFEELVSDESITAILSAEEEVEEEIGRAHV